MASDLRAMLDGCRSDWGNPARFLILADYIDDHVGDTDWSVFIRLSVEFQPCEDNLVPSASTWHPELWGAFSRMAARFTLWASPYYTGGFWMWNPIQGLPLTTALKWQYGVVREGWDVSDETKAAAELMQPGCLDTGEWQGLDRKPGRRAPSPRGRSGSRTPSAS